MAWMSRLLAEGLLERLDIGDLGQEPQLDLRIVGGNELRARRGDEGAPDLAALLGADRDVLQVRLGGGEAAGRGRGERIEGVHPMGAGIDVFRQRVGIGRPELGDLAPLEDLLRQRMPFLGELVEHARAGRPLTGLGLGAARQPELAEQDVAELLGAARIERLAGKLLDLGLERARALGEFAGEPRQHLPVDRDAAPLHAREHRHQRPFQRLVDGADVLGDDARLEQLPQPQGHVGVLGGVFGRPADIDAVECQPGFSRAGERVGVDGLVIEIALRQLLEAMTRAPGIDHVGHQHDVVVGRDLDPAQRKDLPIELEVLADLEHAAGLRAAA